MKRRSKSLPTETITLNVERLSHDGRGIALNNGKTVFVTGGLPQEKVIAKYTDIHSKYDEVDVVEVIEASPQRVSPPCPHFLLCGGCNLQHLNHDAQLQLKQNTLLEQFQHLGKTTPETILPPLKGLQIGYRCKARLGVKFVPKKGGVLVGFRERRTNFLAELNTCVVLHSSVGENITALRNLLSTFEGAATIAQIEVAVSETHTALIFRNLQPLVESDQQKLKDFAKETGLHIYLQPNKITSITPFYPIPAETLYYSPENDIKINFQPSDFTQVNPHMNRQMVQQAIALLNPTQEDHILELFCGLGNFTVPFAKRAGSITAIEGEKTLIQRAEENAQRLGVQNIEYHVANLQQDNLKDSWLHKNYNKIFLDPPRSGAIEILRQLPLHNVKQIVYVSCNPATLARDTEILVHQQGFKLKKAGIMDMFPHTAHVESIALFEKD
jgi:23S rRNA (uracil1939-C5)-methyltransferase